MRAMNRLFAVGVVFVFTAIGCGGEETHPMAHSLEEVETLINDFGGLPGPHELAIQNAADLGAITAEELVYETNAGGAAEAIHHAVAELTMCTHDGSAMNVTIMDGYLDELVDELTAHSVAMSNAADVSAALAEESRHQTAVQSILNDVWAEHTAMTAVGEDYMCPADHH